MKRNRWSNWKCSRLISFQYTFACMYYSSQIHNIMSIMVQSWREYFWLLDCNYFWDSEILVTRVTKLLSSLCHDLQQAHLSSFLAGLLYRLIVHMTFKIVLCFGFESTFLGSRLWEFNCDIKLLQNPHAIRHPVMKLFLPWRYTRAIHFLLRATQCGSPACSK